LIMLRRVIFQSMQQEFRHGRMISNPFTHGVEETPNLDIISKVNDAYLKMMAESDAGDSNHIHSAGYKNFLRDAIYFLYENDRISDAAKWFKYYGEKYPTTPMLDSSTNSLQKNLTLDDYAIGRVQEDIGDTSQERVTSAVQGLLGQSYLDLAIGQNDSYAGYQLLAQKVYERYQKKMGRDEPRVALPLMSDLKHEVLNQLLDPRQDFIPFAARAVIRTQLQMPPETTNTVAPFAITTNTIAPPVSTKAAATNSVGK